MGPQGFQDYHQVYVRTAISVDPEGWAHFEYVKLPEYRWGIFLADPIHDRKIGFGDFYGQALGGDTRVEHLPNAGHWPWVDRPDVVTMTADFLAQG